MKERTTIGAADTKEQAAAHVDTLLNGELANRTAFVALAQGAQMELIRRALVLLLKIVGKRLLK